MTTDVSVAPKPDMLPESAPYWEGLEREELRYQRCGGCGRAVWRPRVACPRCLSRDLRWEASAGRGSIYSYSVVHRAPYAFWEARTPYAIGLIEIDEGYVLFGAIDLPREQLLEWAAPGRRQTHISSVVGMRVSARFDRVEGGGRLLVFAPDPGDGAPAAR